MTFGPARAAAVAGLAVLFAVVLASSAAGRSSSSTGAALPVSQIERSLGASGTVSDHVLTIGIDRNELGTHVVHGTVIKPSFEINGTQTFQPLGGGRALFNADLPLRPSQVIPFIDALLANHLTFQAEHQHFYDLTPEVWFVHYRAVGNPVTIASEAHNALVAVGVKLPQAPPKHPHTPFDVGRLKQILGASSAEVGADGVVTITLTRKNSEQLGGVHLNQNANAETNIAFEPLDSSGSRAAAVPDFGMTAPEIQNVIQEMRNQQWDIACLYNQETDEFPQLFFSHTFKVGDPYTLAQEIRNGLDHMNMQ